MTIEPPPPADRQLLQRLIRHAFAAAPPPPGPDTGLELAGLMRAIHGSAPQLPGVSATEVNKVRADQVRAELFSMPDIRALDANTARERFRPTSQDEPRRIVP